MSTLTDPTFWLAFFIVAAIIIVTGAVTVALRHFTFKLLHWLATKIVALAPPPLGDWAVGLFRFFYASALLCGLIAFVLSFKTWGAPWPPQRVLRSDPAQSFVLADLSCLHDGVHAVHYRCRGADAHGACLWPRAAAQDNGARRAVGRCRE